MKMSIAKKPGKLFFGLVYIIGSILIFYLVLFNWKPDILELFIDDFNRLIEERLILLTTIFMIPSILILKGKKFVSIKFASTVSGLWILMFIIMIFISTNTTEGMAEWLRKITKPLLFITIISMTLWSFIEIFKAQETKR